MVQSCGDSRFTLEAFDRLFAFSRKNLHDLERDDAFEDVVPSLVDDAHSAARDFATDGEVFDLVEMVRRFSLRSTPTRDAGYGSRRAALF